MSDSCWHSCRCDCDAMEAVEFHTPSFGVCHKLWREFRAAEGQADGAAARNHAFGQQPQQTRVVHGNRVKEQLRQRSASARAQDRP